MAAIELTLAPPEMSGFLAEDEAPGLFAADIYIAAMGRSGSTLLCNLMTFEPGHLCIHEPWFMNGMSNESARVQFAQAGIDIAEEIWRHGVLPRRHDSYLLRYRELIAPALSRLTRWGAKEVRGEFHLPTILTIRPKRILLLGRDIRQVAFSLYSKDLTEGSSEEMARKFSFGYASLAARKLVELREMLPHPNFSIARYEDFSASISALSELARVLDWPFAGTPNANFDTFGRASEAKRHGGRMTRAQFYADGDFPPDVVRIADELAELFPDYQRLFGYS